MTAAPLRSTPLADRYVLERELGARGMATVYLARDTKHEAHVTVNDLLPVLIPGGGRTLVDDRCA